MTTETRTPIGYVQATVQVPLYEGDNLEGSSDFDWFIYEEPGITPDGQLGVVRRKCNVVTTEVVYARTS